MHNLNDTEPESYIVLKVSGAAAMRLGDGERELGFCVNSPDGAGYCDSSMLWIADQITEPARVIEIAVHECLHAIFPQLTEEQVDQAGRQIGAVIMAVFQAKGVWPVPEFRQMMTETMREQLAEDFKDRQDVRGRRPSTPVDGVDQ